MFSRRPKVGVGDRLVFYAVGSAARVKAGRIFAVVETTSEPEPSEHERWPWQVRTSMLIPGPRLTACPTIDDIDVAAASLRQSHIALDPRQGYEAERLIAAAACARVAWATATTVRFLPGRTTPRSGSASLVLGAGARQTGPGAGYAPVAARALSAGGFQLGSETKRLFWRTGRVPA